MHELSIAQSIVDTVRKRLPADEKRTVKSLKLKLGELVGIEQNSLAFGFEVASEGTPLHGARLEIEQVPVVYHCRRCGGDFKANCSFIPCPTCGGSDLELRSGDELNVVEVELVDSPS